MASVSGLAWMIEYRKLGTRRWQLGEFGLLKSRSVAEALAQDYADRTGYSFEYRVREYVPREDRDDPRG